MDINEYIYPFDLNGNKASNWISEESAVTTEINGEDFNIIVPKLGPFHTKDIILHNVNSGRTLTLYTDFVCLAPFKRLADTYDRACFGLIAIKDKTLTGQWKISYRTLGGEYALDQDKILQDLANYAFNPRSITYDDIVPDSVPETFPPRPHTFDLDQDVYYTADVIFQINQIALAITGDLAPFHLHNIKDVRELEKELAARVDKYANYKLAVCPPYYVEAHSGAIAIELPIETIGLRVDATFVIGSATGKAVVSVGGVINPTGDFTNLYAVSEGSQPAQTAAGGINSNGHPYIWLGEDTTKWVKTNFLFSDVLLNSDTPEELVDGWKFGIVEFPETEVNAIAIAAGGLAGQGLVPSSRRVNNKTLAQDIVLDAFDVGAVPAVNGKVVRKLEFADGNDVVIRALLTAGIDPVNILTILDDIMYIGDNDKQIVLESGIERPAIRIDGVLKSILVEGEGEGGSSVKFVPESRTINSKELKTDITLNATDVKAVGVDASGRVVNDLVMADGKVIKLVIGSVERPVLRKQTVSGGSAIVVGNDLAQTVLDGNNDDLPAVLINGTLFPILLKGKNDGAEVVINYGDQLKVSVSENNDEIVSAVTQYSDPVDLDAPVGVLLGDVSTQTAIATKDGLHIVTATGGVLKTFYSKNGALVGEDGLAANLNLLPGQGLTLQVEELNGSSEVVTVNYPVLTVDDYGLTIGSEEKNLVLTSAVRPTVSYGNVISQVALLSDIPESDSSLPDDSVKGGLGSVSVIETDNLMDAVGSFSSSDITDSLNAIDESYTFSLDTGAYSATTPANYELKSSLTGVGETTTLSNGVAVSGYDVVISPTNITFDVNASAKEYDYRDVCLTFDTKKTVIVDEQETTVTKSWTFYGTQATNLSFTTNSAELVTAIASAITDGFGIDLKLTLREISLTANVGIQSILTNTVHLPVVIKPGVATTSDNVVTWGIGVDKANGELVIFNGSTTNEAQTRIRLDGTIVSPKEIEVDDTLTITTLAARITALENQTN